MNSFRQGWFTELSPSDNQETNPTTMEKHDANDKQIDLCLSNLPADALTWSGQAFSLKVSEILYHERSSFQDILVFKSETYGTVLVLDGVIQATERDEFSYQEMIAHLALFSHNEPKKVLVIGGGDGGVVREVLKHASVESVVLCEIDEKVVEVSRRFLPSMASGLANPKVTVHIGDGFDYLRKNVNAFDVIITDSSDPIGPACSLFQRPFYELIREALKVDGIFSCQAESMWLHLPLVLSLVKCCKQIFPIVRYAHCSVPSYPSGTIGFLICSRKQTNNLSIQMHRRAEAETLSQALRYYNALVHDAAFVLPQFVQRAMEGICTSENLTPK